MESERSPPDFVIIGMPKAGTTSLHEALAEHPRLAAAAFKEPHYFARDLNEEDERDGRFDAREKTWDEYVGYFAGAKPGQLRFESSTHYVYSTQAPRLILEKNPQCRAILILREPTSWIVSYYQELVKTRVEDLPIGEAYALSKTHTRDSYPKRHTRHSDYGYYDRAVPLDGARRWKRAFDERLLILTMDELTQEWEATRARILAFLGVEDRAIELPRSNPSARIRNPKLSAFIDRLEPHRLRGALGPVYRTASRIYRRAAFQQVAKPEWKPPKADFAERVRAMEDITGLPLATTWGYDENSKP